MGEKEFDELKKRLENIVDDEYQMGTDPGIILRMVLHRITALEGLSCERTYTESQLAELVRLTVR